MNNYIKARDWLKLALSDIYAFFNVKNAGTPGPPIYHLQQSVEKGCKAIISFLGIEVLHTHFPAQQIIKKEIIENKEEIKRLALTGNHLSLLIKVVEYAQPLEEQETLPRYGKEVEDRIILPEEIYTEEKTKHLFDSGFYFWETILQFFSQFKIKELETVLEEIDVMLKKFRQNFQPL